eukprot:3989786-Pyramimonas_sp.AAC.1
MSLQFIQNLALARDCLTICPGIAVSRGIPWQLIEVPRSQHSGNTFSFRPSSRFTWGSRCR